MSSAVYPQGMSSYNNRVLEGGYVSWKPPLMSTSIAPGQIRPLTNNDQGNVFETGFGLPRPLKHYRRGRGMPVHIPGASADVQYNVDRHVRSANGAVSLGNGRSATSLVDMPGSFIVKPVEVTPDGQRQTTHDCINCEGTALITDYYENKPYLTNNPEPNSCNAVLCCNEEYKARKRVHGASTILKKKYYTTHAQYMQNRCQTYEQKAFNFQSQVGTVDGDVFTGVPLALMQAAKPGSPLAMLNIYYGNCYPNAEIQETDLLMLVNAMVQVMFNRGIVSAAQVQAFIKSQSSVSDITTPQQILGLFWTLVHSLSTTNQQQAVAVYNAFIINPYWGGFFSGVTNPVGCKATTYKPSNYKYATQGAVSSSAHNLRINVDTIDGNVAGYARDQRIGVAAVAAGTNGVLNPSGQPSIPFLLKNKVQGCNAEIQTRFQNHRSCSTEQAHPSQPARPSNHYAQSPVNPLM